MQYNINEVISGCAERNHKYQKIIYEQFRGQCVVIAGEEPFAATTAKDAWALAAAAYPNDDGSFILSIPQEKPVRVYGYQRGMVGL